jgi:polyisoprenoid-binding protein YceI
MSRTGTTKFSAHFLDVEDFPDITFRSSGVRSEGSWDIVDGELSIRGVTRPMTLDVELNGFTPDLHGDLQAGFSASSLITDG